MREEMEAPSRIELLHKGFADLSLTTWARRHHGQNKINGAGDEIRTRDNLLGKQVLYH